MIKQNRTKLIILILYTVGILIHFFCQSRPYALMLTTPFLLFINAFVIYHFFKGSKANLRTGIFLLAAFVITVFLEVVGAETGLVFGEYQYGDTMWLQLFNVPLVIGLNWVVLLVASYNVSLKIAEYLKVKSSVFSILITSVFLTLLDYFIEPVAIELDYWHWQNIDIPLQNYLAWFLIALILTIGIKVFRIDMKNKLLTFYYFVVGVYFILLQLILPPC